MRKGRAGALPAAYRAAPYLRRPQAAYAGIRRAGSRGHKGPTHPAALGAMRLRASFRYARLGPLGAPFCALPVPVCAGAPAPARVRVGAARPPPLRGSGPAFSPSGLRPRPPRACLAVPPRFRSGRVRACALRGRSLGSVWFAPCPCFAAGSPWSPLLRRGRGCSQRVLLAGASLRPRLRRLRARRLPALPPGSACGLPSPRGGRAVVLRARVSALAALLRVLRPALLGLASLRPGALPGFALPPPRPCRPSGARGVRMAGFWADPAFRWSLLFATLVHLGPGSRRGPVAAFAARFTFRKLSTPP